MKNYKLIPKVTLWVLLAIGIIASVMFFVGGSEGALEVAGDFLEIPRFTDLLLGWNYVLLALACIITLIFVVIKLIEVVQSQCQKRYSSTRRSRNSHRGLHRMLVPRKP